MRGITARLARGASPPLHPQTKESLRALLWNLQSRGLPAPAPWLGVGEYACPPRIFVTPPKEPSCSLGTHDR